MKWRWTVGMLAAVAMLASGCTEPTESTSPPAAPTTTPAPPAKEEPKKPAQPSTQWNTNDLDIRTNGNVAVAIQQLKQNVDLRANPITPAASDVFKKPWEYYGQVVKLSGLVGIVQDYPPDSQIAKALGAKEASEMVLITEDGTVVDFFLTGSSGQIKAGDNVTVYGYPCGQVTVENQIGGQTTQLVIVGNTFDQ